MRLAAHEIAVVAVFTVWAALSLVRQVDRTAEWVSRFDFLGLVPGWRLFGPEPTRVDYAIYWRGVSEQGIPSEWLPLISPDDRRIWHAVFHPQRRLRKAVSTAVKQLAVQRSSGRGIRPTSTSYLVVFNRVCRLAHGQGFERVQFRVTRCQGPLDPEVTVLQTRTEEVALGL